MDLILYTHMNINSLILTQLKHKTYWLLIEIKKDKGGFLFLLLSGMRVRCTEVID